MMSWVEGRTSVFKGSIQRQKMAGIPWLKYPLNGLFENDISKDIYYMKLAKVGIVVF